MPCGGIYPAKGTWLEHSYSPTLSQCWKCYRMIEKLEEAYFCDEWDCWLHKDCIPEFLKTEEGQVVLAHKHEVIM
jgi:hypothetical protein